MVTSRSLAKILMAAVVGCAFAAPAGAQQPADVWPGLDTSKLQTVFVTDAAARETAGKLLRIDPESLAMLVDGQERRLDRERIVRIQKRDTLRNGVLIGAGLGVALGLVSAGISDCPGDPGGRCAGFRAMMVGMSTVVYTGLGVSVDLLVRGRTTVYRAP
jgi:hypothetical protein